MAEPNDDQQLSGLATLLALSTDVRPTRQAGTLSRPARRGAAGIPAGPQAAAARGLDRLAARLLHGPWPLAAIVLVQAGLSLRLVWSNTAFSDEALYLWSGHLEIWHLFYGVSVPAFQTYFAGAPVIYPVIGAVADAYGGLALARVLSMAFMLGATLLLYSFTSRLFGRAAALSAAAIFAVLGPVQVLGAFATYDPMAIFLLALGARLAIQAGGRHSELFLLAAGVTMTIADATKYATALWTPVVIALAALAAPAAPTGRLRPAVFRAARLTAYVAVPLAVGLLRPGGASYLHGVMFTTLAREAQGTRASPVAVLADSFTWVGVVFVLAVAATALSFAASGRTRWICATLTAAVLLAPVHQAQIQTTTSLHKHVVFGAWFAAAAAGFLLSKLREINAVKAWRASAAVVGLTLFIGYPQATQMFVDGWPDTATMTTELARLIPRAGCPCLVSQQDQVRYYLPGLSNYLIVGPYTFDYRSTAEHRELHGLPAYEDAIRAHYFTVVEIDPAENPSIYRPIIAALSTTRGYRLVTAIPIAHEGRKSMQIWRYAGGGQ